jgi:hypothetical protein
MQTQLVGLQKVFRTQLRSVIGHRNRPHTPQQERELVQMQRQYLLLVEQM